MSSGIGLPRIEWPQSYPINTKTAEIAPPVAVPVAPVSPEIIWNWRIPDELWRQINPLLPPRKRHPLGCHNPRVDDRLALDAIFLVLRTGIRWNRLNDSGPCTSSSAHRRFQEWKAAGFFEELWNRGLLDDDILQTIDWSWLKLDQSAGFLIGS